MQKYRAHSSQISNKAFNFLNSVEHPIESQPNTKPPKMANAHMPHITIFEGDYDQRRHWIIYEVIWEVANITDEKKQIT